MAWWRHLRVIFGRGEILREASAARWWCRSHALTGEHPQAHAAGGEGLHGVDQMGEVAAEWRYPTFVGGFPAGVSSLGLEPLLLKG